ncbi:MAG TPA: hypothetical protein VI932_09500 [Bacteroidota bacterium]|nr:hypothetical protein [Bacteroidota bacterium]
MTAKEFLKSLAKWRVERYEHSLNLQAPDSELRVQLRTDPRYQQFIGRAIPKNVLGYSMTVAALEDVVQGKIRAWRDPARRRSKRQKDPADISRLVEAHPHFKEHLPPESTDQVC